MSERTDVPWRSSITLTQRGEVFPRGRPIAELMRTRSFTQAVLLLWSGDDPEPRDVELLDACLVACMDHGPITPSALVARTAASTGNRPLAAAATGLLSTGPVHGAAVTECARLLASAPADDLQTWAHAVVDEARAAARRIPGLGHRWHDHDPRTKFLFNMMQQQARDMRPIHAAEALSEALSSQLGRRQPINVDGAVAACVVALALPLDFGDCLFGLGRMAGLSAHVVEERMQQRPMRVIDPTQVEYDGPRPTGDATNSDHSGATA